MRVTGTLKFFNAARGFGFVLEDDPRGRGKKAPQIEPA